MYYLNNYDNRLKFCHWRFILRDTPCLSKIYLTVLLEGRRVDMLKALLFLINANVSLFVLIKIFITYIPSFSAL